MAQVFILLMFTIILTCNACSKKLSPEPITKDDNNILSNSGSDDRDNTNNINDDNKQVVVSNDSDDTSKPEPEPSGTSSISSAIYVEDCSTLPEVTSTSTIADLFFYIKNGEVPDSEKSQYHLDDSSIKSHKVCINFPTLEKMVVGEEKSYLIHLYDEYEWQITMKRNEDENTWSGEALFVNDESVIPGGAGVHVIVVDTAVMAGIPGVLYGDYKATQNYEIKGDKDTFQILYEIDQSGMIED